MCRILLPSHFPEMSSTFDMTLSLPVSHNVYVQAKSQYKLDRPIDPAGLRTESLSTRMAIQPLSHTFKTITGSKPIQPQFIGL